MYFEEKIINRILCYRTTSDSDFKPYTQEQLTEKISKLVSENLYFKSLQTND